MPSPNTDSPPPDLKIRLATAADYEAWLPLFRGYQDFYKVDLDDTTTRESWRRAMDSAEPMWCALAWDGEDAVGMVHYLRHRSFWTTSDYCYLQDLFVKPRLRAQGIGRRLIAHVYAEAERLGCNRVWWLTHESNHDAMKLYDQVADRSGFLQYRKLF